MTRRRLQADIDPLSLQDGLARITQRMGIGNPDTISLLFSHWSDVVGVAMADHVVPLQIRDETLHVEVPDPSWALQVRYLESQILTKISKELGSDAVKRISVRVKSHRLD